MNGVLYLAVEQPHVYIECLCSVLSLRSPLHGAYSGPATIITDSMDLADLAAALAGADCVLAFGKSRDFKTRLHQYSLYERTLYLDSDTLLVQPVEQLFDWFKAQSKSIGAPLGAVHYREWAGEGGYGWNSGVLLWHQGELTARFFEAWHRQWQADGCGRDEAAFWRAQDETNTPIANLPGAFNWSDNQPRNDVVVRHTWPDKRGALASLFGPFYGAMCQRFGESIGDCEKDAAEDWADDFYGCQGA